MEFAVSAEYLEQQADCSSYKRIEKRSFVEDSVVFTFPYQTNGNHVTELSTVDHVISRCHWK